MRRPPVVLMLIALAVGGWFFFKRYEIAGLDQIRIKPRQTAATAEANPDVTEVGLPPVARQGRTVRIGSFNIQVFGTSKLDKPQVMKVLVEAARGFDVLAIQEIRHKHDDLMPRFIEQINTTGRHYDFVIGPRLGRTSSKEQYAFVFDTASIEIDRSAVYTVDDPQDALHREPLVAAFRVRGPPADEAFTFTLINCHTDPDETATELDALAEAYLQVRNDGRGEDDIILLGDLNVDERNFGRLGLLSNVSTAFSGVPTNTRGNKVYDHIVLNRMATVEYAGRGGAIDLVRQFNLTLDQALEVSDHLPIWAELSIYEGGQPGRIARQPGATNSRVNR